MKKTRIDWCDCTVNPVVGCPNGCEYCYARKINSRFHFIEKWNEPQFFPERLKQFTAKKPQTVFVDSMSDVGCWKQEWFDEVLRATQNNPQHKYIFLTKRPHDVLILRNNYYAKSPKVLHNVYFGITATCVMDIMEQPDAKYFDFISIEPILNKMFIPKWLKGSNVKTIIIGAETGNRKGRVIPEGQWIRDLTAQADELGMKVFMKESLCAIMGDDFRQDLDIWR